jgi:hypothetical protein
MAPRLALPFAVVALAGASLASVGTSAGLEALPDHLTVSLSAVSPLAFDPNEDELDLLVTVTNTHREGDVFLANPRHTLARPQFLFDKPHVAIPSNSVSSTMRLVTQRPLVHALKDVSSDGIRLAPNGGSAEFHVRATDHLAFHRADLFNISLELPLHARYNGREIRSFRAVTNAVQVNVQADGSERHHRRLQEAATGEKTYEFEGCLGDEKRTIELWMEGALESLQRANLELLGGSFAQQGRHFTLNRDFCYSANMSAEQELQVKAGLERMISVIKGYKIDFKCDVKHATELCKPVADGPAQIQQVGHSTVVLESDVRPTITLCAAFFATAHDCAYQAESAPNLLLGMLSQSLGVTSRRAATGTPGEGSNEVLHSPSRPVLTPLEIEAAVTDTWSQQCFTQDPRGNTAQKATLCNAEYQQAHNQRLGYELTHLQQDFMDMALVTKNYIGLVKAVDEYSSSTVTSLPQFQPSTEGKSASIMDKVAKKEWQEAIDFALLTSRNEFIGTKKGAFNTFMTEVGRKAPKTCPKALELLASAAANAIATAAGVAQAAATVYGSTDADAPLTDANGLAGTDSPSRWFESFMALTKLKAARFGVLYRCENDEIHVLRAISQSSESIFMDKFNETLANNPGYNAFFEDPVGQRAALVNGFKKHWARVLYTARGSALELSSEGLREAAAGATLSTMTAATFPTNPSGTLVNVLTQGATEIPSYYRLADVSKWVFKSMMGSLGMLEGLFDDEAELRAAGFGWIAGRAKALFADEATLTDFQESMEAPLK